MPFSVSFSHETVAKEQYQLTAMTNTNIRIDRRISEEELKAIERYFTANKSKLYNQLKKMPVQKSLRIKADASNQLPRSLMVFLNQRKEMRCLIRLKGKLANRQSPTVEDPLYISQGEYRAVKLLVELYTRDIFVETINYHEEHQLELSMFGQIKSKYVSSFVCYAADSFKTITVAPYYAKGSLSEEAIKKLTQGQKNRLVMQLLFGVKAMHDAGFAHNDLKLLNVLMKNDNDIVIIDLDAMTKDNKQGKRGIIYTPGYQSPETTHVLLNTHPGSEAILADTLGYQVLEYKPFDLHSLDPLSHDHRSGDMWSLGVMIHEINNNGVAPELSFVQRDPENILIEGDYQGENRKKLFLDRLAHACLQPSQHHRYTIDDAIFYLFISLAKEVFFTKTEKFLKGAKLFEYYDELHDEGSRLKICELFFSEYVDLFYQLSLPLQTRVLNYFIRTVLKVPEANFVSHLAKRDQPLDVRYSKVQIKYAIFSKAFHSLAMYRKQVSKIFRYLHHRDDERQDVVNYLSAADPQQWILMFLQDAQRMHVLMSFLCRLEIPFKLSTILLHKKVDSKRFLHYFTQQHLHYYLVDLFIRELGELRLNEPDASRFISKGLWVFDHCKANILSLEQRERFAAILLKNAMQHYPFSTQHEDNLFFDLLIEHYGNKVPKTFIQNLKHKSCPVVFFARLIDKIDSKQVLEWAQLVGFTSNNKIDSIGGVGIFHWDIQQMRIAKAVRDISKATDLTTHQKIHVLERIYQSIYRCRSSLYPLRYGFFDAIGSFILQSEKISHRCQVQLEDIQQRAYSLLKALPESADKVDLIKKYSSSMLFNMEFADGYREQEDRTNYQLKLDKLINKSLRRSDESMMLESRPSPP